MLPRSIPRVDLGLVSSPLEAHPALAAAIGIDTLLVKRDDLNAADFGGNKRRALAFLLADRARIPVSMGGYGSTWCAALTTLAARLGRPATVALFPQPWTPTVAGLLSTSLNHGDVVLARSRLGVPAALWRAIHQARRRGPTRWIGAGGATPLGVLGSVAATLEFTAQVEEHGYRRPEAVIAPLGSGGTVAGLLLGLRLAGWKSDVIGVRVADAWVANRWQVGRLVRATERLLRRHGAAVPDGDVALRVDTAQLGGGYGHATDAASTMQAHFAASGITLDLTYSGKAAAALYDAATRYRQLCFWHTFDTRLVSAPLVGHPLLVRAQSCAESLWPHSKLT